MFKAFLIKYAEIGLKGNNRYLFENALCDRIKDALKPLGTFRVFKEQGRVFVECPDDYDYEETVEALKRVFGISSFCPVVTVSDTDWENLTKAVGDYVEVMYQRRILLLRYFPNGRTRIIRFHLLIFAA